MRFFITPDETYGGWVASGDLPRKYYDVVTADEVEEIETENATLRATIEELKKAVIYAMPVICPGCSHPGQCENGWCVGKAERKAGEDRP